MRKFIEYLPDELKKYLEFQQIGEANDKEFIELKHSSDRVLFNSFISLLDDYGCARWEKILHITKFDTDTLDDRRLRILSYFLNRLPYTEKKLRETLDRICGENRYFLDIDVLKHKVTVKLDLGIRNQFVAVYDLLEGIVPLNLLLLVDILYNRHTDLKAYTHLQLKSYTHEQCQLDEGLRKTEGNKTPIISGLKATNITTNSIVIKYKILDENKDTVKHYISVKGLISEKDITSLIQKNGDEISYKVTGLSEGKKYSVKIKVEDEEGAIRESSILVTTVMPEPINNPPEISGLSVFSATTDSIEIRYSVKDESKNTLKHYITVEGLEVEKDITGSIIPVLNGYKYTVIGLNKGTQYTISIKCKDDKGQGSNVATIKASTTVPVPINQPPTISNLRKVSTSENTITIEYNAMDEDKPTLRHFLTIDGLYKDIEIKPTNDYRYVIGGLNPGTGYNISIKVTDKGGLSATSNKLSVTTVKPKPINQPPTISNLVIVGKPTKNKIDISYKVSDESIETVKHYLTVDTICTNKDITSTVIRVESDFTYSIEGLKADTTYTIKIKVTDNEGLNNEKTVSATTDKEEVKPPTPEPGVANIVGFKIDESNPDSKLAVSYIEDNAGYTSAVGTTFNDWEGKWPFNQIKPCFLKKGKVVGYLKQYEYTRMEDGTEIDDTGDVMTEYPKMYWSFKRSGNSLEVRLSDKKIDDSYICPAFMRKGKEYDHAYLGGYYASEINGRMASLPGKTPITNKGKIELRNLACRNGEGYEQLIPYIWTLEQILEILFYKSLDSQRSLGVGPNYALTKAQTGATKLSGLLSGDTTQFSNVKFFGLENLWGSGTTTLDGIEIKNKKLFINQTGHPNDGTEAVGDFTGMTGWNTSQAGYMSKAFGTNRGCFFPCGFTGSDYQYYTDDCYVETDNSDFTCYVGGDASGGLYKNGIFYLQQFTDPGAGGSGRLYFARLTYVG